MPKIALYRPAISQPCGMGEVCACAYRGGGGEGRCGPLSIFLEIPLTSLSETSPILLVGYGG